ncbi:MAG: hypothetical protein ACREJ5_09880 [Geminicoccaceae bacterium]
MPDDVATLFRQLIDMQEKTARQIINLQENTSREQTKVFRQLSTTDKEIANVLREMKEDLTKSRDRLDDVVRGDLVRYSLKLRAADQAEARVRRVRVSNTYIWEH